MKGITSLLTTLLPRLCLSICSVTLYEIPVLLNSCLVVISTCWDVVTVSVLTLAISTSPSPLSAVPNLAPFPLSNADSWSAKASSVPGSIPLLWRLASIPAPRAFFAEPSVTSLNWVVPSAPVVESFVPTVAVSNPSASGWPKRVVSLWPAALSALTKNSPSLPLEMIPSTKESIRPLASSLSPESKALPAPLENIWTLLLSTTPVFCQVLSPWTLVSMGEPIFRSDSVLPAKFSSHAFHWIALQPSASGGYKSINAW